jgi:ABC-type antimicrobial peptide transport system permease subunit
VLRDAKYNDLRAGVEPMIFLPLMQAPYPIMSIEVRAAGDPLGLTQAVRQTIREVSPNVVVRDMTTLAKRLDSTLVHERMLAQLSGLFGALALVLACVGLYGTMSYAVARRTNEIGIRMALGAERRQMVWMVLRDVLLLVGVGIAIGLPAALAATRLLEQYLFGLKPGDPITIAAATLLLLAVALLAGYVPARRAAHVDPMSALRYE